MQLRNLHAKMPSFGKNIAILLPSTNHFAICNYSASCGWPRPKDDVVVSSLVQQMLYRMVTWTKYGNALRVSKCLTSHVNHADTHDLRLVVASPIPRCSRERDQDGRIPFNQSKRDKWSKAFGWLVHVGSITWLLLPGGPVGMILPNRSRATLVQETQYHTTWESQFFVKLTWRNMAKPEEMFGSAKRSNAWNQLIYWTVLKYGQSSGLFMDP